ARRSAGRHARPVQPAAEPPGAAARPVRPGPVAARLRPEEVQVRQGPMSGFHLRGVVLPDGEERDLWVVNGRVRTKPVPLAETIVDGGFLLSGLVDAHC